ncbi:hypothetical protein KIL84_006496 [Mauremys mutica]|uniref:Uncharacterized protein n=1 Tax=Mauremys mutica TaxID=74926 RepID=A0A9D4AU48_9SAUR|nr:hypothetical protein KIL84_006496 [Mauremys mutica]
MVQITNHTGHQGHTELGCLRLGLETGDEGPSPTLPTALFVSMEPAALLSVFATLHLYPHPNGSEGPIDHASTRAAPQPRKQKLKGQMLFSLQVCHCWGH